MIGKRYKVRDTADLARSGTRGSLPWMQPPLILPGKTKRLIIRVLKFFG